MATNLAQLVLDGLKKRLDNNNQITVQKKGGKIYTAQFTFNPPATEELVIKFSRETHWHLPPDFKNFLLLHNGARLFENTKTGGGYELLSLYEIPDNHLDYMPKNWYPISINNGDYIFIDSDKAKNGQTNYLVCFNHDDVSTTEGHYLKMTFETWLDKLIITQGAEFWTW
ncbi:SMI1/KNR4 family protein [Brevibacillus sp. FSL K6-0770]|uniref:SMI1/KNR4 family protein n=1 Tax=unclassified Brevibacillus TaxID=2684853 RepID=UPI00247345E4|nr:SMI1/KNR4 family protein [Brevibacillus sp. 1238]MDH6352845.1 cell wall assembly regulator SMI1 [Brevibacillus sp. 1238]